jgi:hypothetical protein
MVPQGTAMALTFGAADDGSGVLSVSATLNGDPVTNGQVVTFSALGANTFVVTAVDNAGNPAARAVDFQVVASSTLSCRLLY